MRTVNNVATSDGYASAATVEAPDVERVNMQVLNAAAFVQLGAGWPGVVYAGNDELFSPPGFYSLDESDLPDEASGCRARSAVAGVPARVTIQLVTRGAA